MAPFELPLVLVFVSGVIATQLAVSKSFTLFDRYLWLDEIVTHVLVRDANLGRSTRALVTGLDTNPPGYHLLLRLFLKLTRADDETAMRSFALLATIAALIGLYAAVRLAAPPVVAIAVLLAIWQHPLVVRFAFEGRMYALWLASSVWFASAFARMWMSPTDVRLQVLVIATGLLTCASHTLGPLAVALSAGAVLVARGPADIPWRVLASASVGPLAFLAWTPFLKKQDSAHLGTWISAPTRRTMAQMARSLALPSHVGTMLLLAGGLTPFLSSIGPERGPATIAFAWLPLAGLASLALLPVALVLLSYLQQPLCNERYAFPAVAAFAPAAAFIMSPVAPAWAIVVCGGLILTGIYEIDQLATGFRARDRQIDARIHAIRQHIGSHVVVFESLIDFAPVWRYAPDLRRHCFMLDFEMGELGPITPARLAGRDQARLFTSFYPDWLAMPWRAVRELPLFFVVSGRPHEERSVTSVPYPGFCATPIASGLFVLEADQPGPERERNPGRTRESSRDSR